ncbi:MAG: two-component regulator propeller domain-containing protein [Ignavibacteriales bacterium]
MRPATFIFALLFYFNSFCQEYNIHHFEIGDNKTNSIVTCIAQDKDGYIWFGSSRKGVYRYDGKNFKLFSKENGFGNYFVRKIYTDSQKDLWFCTGGKILIKYDGRKFSYFKSPSIHDNVSNIVEYKGNIWFSSGCDLIKFDGNNFTTVFSFNTFSPYEIKIVKKDNKGNLILVVHCKTENNDMQDIVYVFDGNNCRVLPVPSGKKIIVSLYIDSRNNVWFGQKDKIIKYDGNIFSEIILKSGYLGNIIRDMLEDANGKLWICSNELIKYDGKNIEEIKLSESYAENPCLAIFRDKESNIWVGTKNNLFQLSKKNFNFFNNIVASIRTFNILTEDRKGNLWFSAANKIARYDGIHPPQIFDLKAKIKHIPFNGTEDSHGNIWFTTRNELLKYDGKSFTVYKLKDNLLILSGSSALVEGSDGSLMAFNGKDRIYRFDGHDFALVLKESDGPAFYKLLNSEFQLSWTRQNKRNLTFYYGNKLTRVDIGDLFITKGYFLEDDSSIWIITNKLNTPSALVQIDKATGSIKKFDYNNGMPQGRILEYTFDAQGNIWLFINNKGISKFDLNEYYRTGKISFVNYPFHSVAEDLVSNSCYLDRKGNIWVRTPQGWYNFSPADFDPVATVPPTIVFNSVNLFFGNHDISKYLSKSTDISEIPRGLDLPFNENHLTFGFTALTFKDPEGVKYSYKLEGFDKDWSPLNKFNEVTYTNIPPGSYILKVKAILRDGTPSIRPAEYSFVIHPPFWKTWWFFILSFSILAGLMMLIIKIRTYQIRKQNIKLEKLVSLRTSELQEEKIKVQQEKERVEIVNDELEKSRYQLAKINEVQTKWLEELSESEHQLKEVNKSKDKFFSIISHDLKSPFFSLIGFTDLILEEFDKLTPEDLKKYTLSLNKSTKNIYSLIEKLLDWSRVQTGRVEYKSTAYDISQQVQEIVSLHSGNLLKKRITLKNYVHDNVYVRADENMIRSVLHNLISNAIKFTYEGGTVEVGSKIGNNTVEFYVADNGTGINAETMVKLFKIDSHHTNLGTAQEQGTGLGLILCKEFIEKNGGTISVESIMGKGSKFKFTLPRSVENNDVFRLN